MNKNYNTDLYISRLEKFADYLDTIVSPEKNDLDYATFINIHDGYPLTYGVQYHKWILMYLTDLFPEFYLDEVGDVCYNLGGLSLNGIMGIYLTFGFSETEEFRAILEVENDELIQEYGIRILRKSCSAKDIAFNIRKVAEYRRNKLFQS